MQHTKPEMESDEGSIYLPGDTDTDDDGDDGDSDDDDPNRVLKKTLVDHHWNPFLKSMSEI